MAVPAHRRAESQFFASDVSPPQRPRRIGITHVIDRLHGLNPAEIAPLASYIDFVKIGWGLPLLISRSELKKRIKFYHDVGVEVSTAGTLLEYAVTRDKTRQMMDEARQMGFDLVEVSDGIIDLSPTQVERMVADAGKRGLEVFILVGKRSSENQLSLRGTLERIARARALSPRKVILESHVPDRGVGIYDVDGSVKWDWVRTILADHPAEELIFEAPLERQQTELLKELGAEVNLGDIALASVAPLASERLGLRGDTFGNLRTSRAVAGPPATKFLYYLLESYRALDQSELIRLSRLPRRTVQSGLESLRRQGLVHEGVSLADSRRREYRLA